MRLFTQYQVLVPALIVSISFFFSCTKEKTPTPVTPQPTKWEKIAGHYKVFDTTGVYLYDMDLVHTHYHIEDLTPYYAFDCKQIAVKQH